VSRAVRPSASAWPARMALLAVIWGFSFLLIKVTDPVFGPVWVALLRILFGLLALAVVLLLRRLPLPRGRRLWVYLAVAALLFNVLPFTLFAIGEVHTSSVLAGILNATTPLFTLPAVLLLVPDERPSASRLLGLGIGLAGVVVVLAPWHGSGGGSLFGNLLCLLAAASYGLGFAYTRRFLSDTGAGPLALATAQLLCAAIELGIGAAAGRIPPAGLSVGGLAAVVALGGVGTGLAYALNYSILRDAGPTTASTVTYLIPIVATLAGVILLGDRLGWEQPLGTVVVLVGAALAQGRLHRRPAPRESVPVSGGRPPVRPGTATAARPGRRAAADSDAPAP
jgi:drug/metabolite transporter (DMT)-like permease